MLEALDWEDVYTRKNLLDYPSWEKAFPLSKDPPRSGWRQLWSDRVMRAQALNDYSDWLAAVRRGKSASPADRRSRLEEADGKAQTSANPLSRNFIPAASRAPAREAVSILNYRLCRLAVALAWFEAERGRAPASLEELVPRHLAALPECPLSGTPFRYAPGKVWSVGKDGKDDGGVIDEMYGYDPEREGADAVWFVKRR